MDENRMINIPSSVSRASPPKPNCGAALRSFSNMHLDCRLRGTGTYCRICELTPYSALRFRRRPPIHRLPVACIRAGQQVFTAMEF
jgi:hypothetical protein